LNLQNHQIHNNVETGQDKQEETRRWQIFTIILVPCDCSSGVLLWFWQVEFSKRSTRRHTTDYTSRTDQEFYRRKLTIYEKVHQQMADLTNALDDVSSTREQEIPLTNCMLFI